MGFQERPEFWLHWSSGFGPLTAPTCPTMRFAASRWARQEFWCWCALLNSRIPRDLTRDVICMWTFAYCWQPPKQVGTLLFGWMGRKESEQTCVWPLLVRFGEQFVWHFDKQLSCSVPLPNFNAWTHEFPARCRNAHLSSWSRNLNATLMQNPFFSWPYC